MDKIIVSGDISVNQLLQLHIITEVNEHGKAFFSGIISKQISQNILKKSICSVIIRCESETDETILFAGQIQKYVLKRKGDVCYLEAECFSTSKVFDEKKRSRSFQDVRLTYGKLYQQIAGKGRNLLVTKDGNIEIPHPFIQYEETDWDFLKRIAGHQKAVVIPDVCHMYPQVSIGMIQGKTYEMDEQESCEVEKNIKKWRHQNSLDSKACENTLKIEGALNINLCDKIIYNGVKLVVLKKEVKLSNEMLICSCWIGKEQLEIINLNFNHDLCGLRLAGKVEAVVGEKIKIRLTIDGINDTQELFQYKYLPITGNGMYAMPETGSIVHLYFPDNNEKNAFVVDCQSSKPLEGVTYNYRYLKTAEKNVLGLLPSELSIKTRSNEVKIFDKSGIDFFTKKKVRLSAKEDIIIRNKGILNLHAKESVFMEYNNGNHDYILMEGVECTIKTKIFLASDAGRKTEQVERYDPKLAWRAAETAKNTVSKVLGAIPSNAVEGIGGKILGGIPSYENVGMEIDISKVAGVKIGGD